MDDSHNYGSHNYRICACGPPVVSPRWGYKACPVAADAMGVGVVVMTDTPLKPDRFWSKVNKTESCWLWTASINPEGYGKFWVAGKGRLRAHRVAYELVVGPIPEGLQIDHLCRVRHCVNPSHLEPVTHRENLLRGIGIPAVNAKKTHCLRGHPFSGDNLYIEPKGGRRCRECRRAVDRRRPRNKGLNHVEKD